MKLTKRRREGYSILNNNHHSPPHTEKPPQQLGKNSASPEVFCSGPLSLEDLFDECKCTQSSKDIRQDIRNLRNDIHSHLRHTFLRLRGRGSHEETKTPGILKSTSIRPRALDRCPSHTETCPWALTRRSILKAGLKTEVTSEDWLNTFQHFAQVEKIKNEMEKEKKMIGKLRWRYWKWVDSKQGTRLAEERLGERVECRREAERECRGF